LLKNNFLLKFIYLHYNYNYFDFKIYLCNIYLFNSFILNKYSYKNNFFLNYPVQYKYNWINSKSNFYKTFNIDSDIFMNTEFSEFLKITDLTNFNKINHLNNLINFKKNSGFFKKDNKFNSVVLNRLQGLKNNPYKNNINLNNDLNLFNKNNIYKNNANRYFLSKYIYKNINKVNFENQFFSKNMDIKIKSFFIFKKNREILNKLLIDKPIRQFKFNKFIKNFLKKNNSDILSNFEFKLVNLLIRSCFFVNFKDALFFIENGYITVNNKIMVNPNYLLNKHEIVKISFNKYYYLYYRKGLHNVLSNIGKYNSYAWRVNKNKYNVNKQQSTHTPSWILRFMYFRDDLPKYLEVDYLSMTMIILYKPYNTIEFDFYTLKFMSSYLSRLYNWKFII